VGRKKRVEIGGLGDRKRGTQGNSEELGGTQENCQLLIVNCQWLWLAAAFLEFGFEVGEGEVAVGEEDEEVVEEVGRFFDEALVALAFGGEDEFDGFFADFFDDFVFAGGEEVGGVGVGGGLVLTSLNDGE
jgi:hypothetical protein